MIEMLNISWETELKKLINEYKFNIETLSKYLSVSMDDLINFAKGREEKLAIGANGEFELSSRVLFFKRNYF